MANWNDKLNREKQLVANNNNQDLRLIQKDHLKHFQKLARITLSSFEDVNKKLIGIDNDIKQTRERVDASVGDVDKQLADVKDEIQRVGDHVGKCAELTNSEMRDHIDASFGRCAELINEKTECLNNKTECLNNKTEFLKIQLIKNDLKTTIMLAIIILLTLTNLFR